MVTVKTNSCQGSNPVNQVHRITLDTVTFHLYGGSRVRSRTKRQSLRFPGVRTHHMQLHRIRYRNLCFKGSIRNIRNDPSIFQCQGSNPLMHKCNHVTFHLYGFKGSIPQHSIIFQCQGSNPKAHADRSRYSTRVRTLHCKLQRRKVNHLEASNEASM